MKKVVLVAGHFPPSNLTSGHRSRLWSIYLKEFGWEPTIVTTHWRYYEEPLDEELEGLLAKDLRVIRTNALPTKPLRLVGDIGVRGFLGHYSALTKLAGRGEMDFLHITIPSNFSAPLGRLIHRRFGIPYGIDYIDPWIYVSPETNKIFTKAWWAHRLGLVMEPWSVRDASLITGVAPGYYEDMLERNPGVTNSAVCAAMPYGIAEEDFNRACTIPPRKPLFNADDGYFHMVYAGAMLPDGYEVLEVFLDGLVTLKKKRPDLAAKIRVHFVGTGRSVTDKEGFNILPRIIQKGVRDIVTEHPARIPYVEVLRHLRYSSAILVMGSTKAHYTPSKVFQGILSRHPVLALLHENSTALRVLKETGAGIGISFSDRRWLDKGEVCEGLRRIMDAEFYNLEKVNWDALGNYSARMSARELASALNKASASYRSNRGQRQ